MKLRYAVSTWECVIDSISTIPVYHADEVDARIAELEATILRLTSEQSDPDAPPMKWTANEISLARLCAEVESKLIAERTRVAKLIAENAALSGKDPNCALCKSGLCSAHQPLAGQVEALKAERDALVWQKEAVWDAAHDAIDRIGNPELTALRDRIAARSGFLDQRVLTVIWQLADAMNELKAERGRLRAALEFYAAEEHYGPAPADILEDLGAIAREALEEKP